MIPFEASKCVDNGRIIRCYCTNEKKPLPPTGESGFLLLIGRGEKIRTSDPHNPIVVRYQAALRPDRVLEPRATARDCRAAIIPAMQRLGKKGF